jgi:signal peptidase complex subunit 2
MYDLILAYRDGKSGKMRESSVQRSVADFFDENGQICMDLVEAAVLKMHKSLASDKKDS